MNPMLSEIAKTAKIIFRQKKPGQVWPIQHIELINDVLILIDSYFEAKDREEKTKIQKQKQEKDKKVVDSPYDCYD